MKYEFVRHEMFTNQLVDLNISDEVIRRVENEIMENSERAPIESGCAGARKIRIALNNRGKSSGGRIVYRAYENYGIVIFFFIFTKDKFSDLPPAYKAFVKQMVKDYEKELVTIRFKNNN